MRNIRQTQQGAALAVGLILLVIITLMGYTGMKSTMLQERMAGGLHNRSLANSGAHSSLRAAEDYLFNLIEETNGVPMRGTPTGNQFGIYSMYQQPGIPTSGKNIIAENFSTNDWTTAPGTQPDFDFTTLTEKGAALKFQPEYLIQQVRETSTISSIFGGSLSGAGGATHEYGAGGSGGGSGGSSGSSSTTQDTYLVTAKSRSGDGNSFAITESIYTVVTSSSATN